MSWIKYLPTLAMASSQALVRHKATKLTRDHAQAKITLDRLNQIDDLRKDAEIVQKLMVAKNVPDVVKLVGDFTLNALKRDIEKKHPHLVKPKEVLATPKVSSAEAFATALYGSFKEDLTIHMIRHCVYPEAPMFTYEFPATGFPSLNLGRSCSNKALSEIYSIISVFFLSGNPNPTVEDYLSSDAVYFLSEAEGQASILYHTEALKAAASAHKSDAIKLLHKLILKNRLPPLERYPAPGVKDLAQPVVKVLSEAWQLAESRNGLVKVLIQGSPGTGKTQSIREACAQMGWHRLICNHMLESFTGGVAGLNPFGDVYCFEDLDRYLTPLGTAALLKGLDRSECLKGHPALLIITTNNLQKLPAAVRRPGRLDFVINMDSLLPFYGAKEILALWDFIHQEEPDPAPPLSDRQIEVTQRVLHTGYLAAATTYLERVKLYGQDYEMPPWDMSFRQPPSLDPHEVYQDPKKASSDDTNFRGSTTPKPGDEITLADGTQFKVGQPIYSYIAEDNG